MEINLANRVKEAIGDSYDVIHISDPEKALLAVRKERPLMIVLGYIEPQGTAYQLYSKIKEGWTTRYIPILIVETESQDSSKRVLKTEESQKMDADEYLLLSNAGGNTLKETIQKHLKR